MSDERLVYEGKGFVYRGALPSCDAVLFASYGRNSSASCAMYQSALEAAASGYDGVNIAENSGNRSVLKGYEDGGGRLYVVTALSMDEYERRFPDILRRIMLTGGGLIAPSLTSGNRDKAYEIALSFSSMLMVSSSAGFLPQIVSRAIDSGLDVYMLRASLADKAMRRLFREGCPSVQSFSSIFPYPDAIAYEDNEDGCYNFLSKGYSIVRADETD